MSARIVSAEEGMTEAVARLRAGELVAFPTETVYGLGANALDPAAVARIFSAKGRPSTNPLIVHVADTASARALARNWPAAADDLARRFWPGPLTLVVEKSDAVPAIVTAGGRTVGLRVPDHPVALELLRRCGLPIAAPSANRSEEISPTRASHVADSLGPYVEGLLILDGGPCRVGIESTVLDVTVDPPQILRPGHSPGPLPALFPLRAGEGSADGVRSPGQSARHYAPRKPVALVPAGAAADLPATGTPDEYAARLYAEMRRLDADPSISRIRIEWPPETFEWEAIRDRLRRAAAPRP